MEELKIPEPSSSQHGGGASSSPQPQPKRQQLAEGKGPDEQVAQRDEAALCDLIAALEGALGPVTVVDLIKQPVRVLLTAASGTEPDSVVVTTCAPRCARLVVQCMCMAGLQQGSTGCSFVVLRR